MLSSLQIKREDKSWTLTLGQDEYMTTKTNTAGAEPMRHRYKQSGAGLVITKKRNKDRK